MRSSQGLESVRSLQYRGEKTFTRTVTMMLNTPNSPFTRAQEMLGDAHLKGEHLLVPHSCGGPGPEAMEEEAETLLLALWPQIRARYTDADRENALSILWSVVSLGGTIEDLDEALLLFDLIARYADEVSTLEIREVVRLLGDQADLFLEPWVRGLHQRLTGTQDIAVALWEHRTYLLLSDEGANWMRARIDLPPNVANVSREGYSTHERPTPQPSEASPARGRALR